jgi:peptidyl-prolyl cis-trans isomerase SDCCAG10
MNLWLSSNELMYRCFACADRFFITLSAAPELNQKNTIFGTVVGDGLYNCLKIGEGELIRNTERPSYPFSIKSIEVLDNPFDDLQLRMTAEERREQEKARKEMKRKRKEAREENEMRQKRGKGVK